VQTLPGEFNTRLHMSDIKLTPEQETALRSQVFDDTHPGAVLHDFALVLDYVGEKGVKAGGKYNLLPIEAVIALDPKLARPMNLPLKRPQLRSHPYLQGLHLLLRASTLGRVEGKGDKARLVIDPATLASWYELNPTERYCSLLEAWLLISRPEMVGERGDDGFLLDKWSIPYRIVSLLEEPSRKRKPPNPFEFVSGREVYNVALADLFGLVSVPAPQELLERMPRRTPITPFGDAQLTLLAKWLDEEDEVNVQEGGEFDEEEWEEEAAMPGLGVMQPVLEPYFPAYQKTLSTGAPTSARDGVFVFKISLGRDVWRRIALAHHHTLDDLMSAILRSIRFDFDHLYVFTYRDALGRTVEANHPACNEGVSADTVELGTLPLQPGQSMSLVYDFGDSWHFDVKLERIDPPGSMKKVTKVIESHGKAPKQYPDWD
jgi:hypothetical protein